MTVFMKISTEIVLFYFSCYRIPFSNSLILNWLLRVKIICIFIFYNLYEHNQLSVIDNTKNRIMMKIRKNHCYLPYNIAMALLYKVLKKISLD